MVVKELNRNQLLELKQQVLCARGNQSYEDLAQADELVSDEELVQLFGDTVFSEDDFEGEA